MHEIPIPTARDIMTRRVISLREDMRVIDAMRELLRHKITGAPVLDADDNVVGLVSEFDCLRVVASGLYGHEEWEDSEPLRRIMTREIVTIPPDADLFAVTQLLVDRRIRRVPVAVDGKIIGIVSRSDVLRGVHELRRAEIRLLLRHPEKGLYLSATDHTIDEIPD